MSRPKGSKNKKFQTEPTMKNGGIEINSGNIKEILDSALVTLEKSREEPQNINNCEYHLIMSFNGETFDCFTNNLKISILSFKPKELFTEGYIHIEKGNANFDRKYSLVELRKILSDEERIELFISQLQLG